MNCWSITASPSAGKPASARDPREREPARRLLQRADPRNRHVGDDHRQHEQAGDHAAAAERALRNTGRPAGGQRAAEAFLPRDVDGRVPSSMSIDFRPQE